MTETYKWHKVYVSVIFFFSSFFLFFPQKIKCIGDKKVWGCHIKPILVEDSQTDALEQRDKTNR